MHTGGFEVIAIGGSWHGVTGAAAAASFASDRRGYGVPTPGVFAIPEPNTYRPHIDAGSEEASAMACLELGLKMFDMTSAGKPAAIIVEPVISAGGVLVPPKCYLEGLRKAADDRGMLLIFEQAQTAFGRIGTRTGAEYFGITPDIMSVSKTLGGGVAALELSQPMKLRMTYIKEASVIIQATYRSTFSDGRSGGIEHLRERKPAEPSANHGFLSALSDGRIAAKI